MKSLSIFVLCALSMIQINAQNFSIGNKVFFDLNEDNLYTAEDAGAIGVSINLWSVENGELSEIVTVTITDNQGEYLFENLEAGVYALEIPTTNFENGGPLNGFEPCTISSDANDGIDNDNNGIENLLGLGSIWTEFIEVNNGTADLELEMTVDFCFIFNCGSYPMSINCAEAAQMDPIVSTSAFGNLCGSMSTEISTGDTPNPLCPDGGSPHNMSWFSFIAGSTNLVFELVPFNCTVTGGFTGIQVGVYTDCTFQESIYCDPNCQTAPSVIGIGIDWVPGEVYYVFLDGCAGSVCDFEIILLEGEIGPEEGVIVSVNCDNAEILELVTPEDCLQPENIVSITDSLGNENLPMDIPCFQAGTPINWYQLDIQDNSADFIMTHVQADGFTPVWAFYRGNDCDSLTLVSSVNSETNEIYECSYSDGYNNNTQYIPFETGTTYWLAVSSIGDIVDSSFTLSYSSFLDCLNCYDRLLYDCEKSIWTSFVDGEENNGPFSRGENVTICTSIDYNTSASGNDWMHGIIPNFGPGWEINSAGPAAQIPSQWDWVDAEGECATTVNGYDLPNMCTYIEDGLLKLCNKACDPACPCEGPLLDNSPLPSGWFYNSSGGSNTCVSGSCIPAENWGIPGGVTVAVDLCFDLIVKNEVGVDCNLNNDLQISLLITSDVITGCWDDTMPCLNGFSLLSPEWEIDCGQAAATPLLSLSVCNDDLPYTYEGITVDENSDNPTLVFDYVLPNTPAADGGDSIVDLRISIVEFDVTIIQLGCSDDGYEVIAETLSNVNNPDATNYIWSNTSTGEILGESMEVLVPLDVTSVTINAMIENDGIVCSSISTIDLVIDSIEMPLEILGLDTLCVDNPIENYSAVVVDSNNVIGYEWIVTQGQGIISGLNDQSTVEVQWQSSEGTLCVSAIGQCNISDALCIDIIVTSDFMISAPVEISGRDSLCSNSPTNIYTAIAPNDDNVIDYEWEITAGEGALTSLTLDNQIFVNWSSSAGTICARTVGECAISEQTCKDIVVIDLPTPNFSWTVIDVDNKIVQFTYTGSQPIDSYFWEFDDDSFSNDISPVHQFSGTQQLYEVILTTILGPCEEIVSYEVDILLDHTTAIQEIESLLISPNPNRGLFYIDIELSNPIDMTLEIMDINGRLVQRDNLSNHDLKIAKTIDLYDAPSGAYLVRFISNKGIITERVVVD